jgi:hypothetical protein
MDRLLDALKIVMGLGVVALVAIVVALVIAGTGPTKHGHSAARRVVATPSPVVTLKPIPSKTANAPPTAAQRCERSQSGCSQALLGLINRGRIEQAKSPLIFDSRQSRGFHAFGSAARCVGSRGHSKAMARSGRLWRRNRAFPRASFPHDICGASRHPGEVVTAASGTEWAALKRAATHLLSRGRSNAATRRLLAGRFHRAGVGIAHRNRRYFITVDLLR